MKMDIVLAIPGLPFNGDTFDKQSLGGSETAGYYMARALATLGHKVTVFCSTPKPIVCKHADYFPIQMFRQYVEHVAHDVCVVQRIGELYSTQNSARFSALWCHDLAMGRQEGTVKGTAWNYDKVFVLSEFMRKQYQEVYTLPDELLFQTRNGVDLGLVESVREEVRKKANRNPLALVYSARPERGLDVLLREIMPRILAREPQARLFLSAYDNNVPELADYYAQCAALAAKLGDRVVNLGALTKAQLYEVYHSSGLYVYPLPSFFAPDFDEISCITAMEVQACGLPIVTSLRGALSETIAPGAGVLVPEKVHTKEYYDAFADAALQLMQNPHEWRQASNAGLERAKTLSWDGVARQWTELFEAELAKTTESQEGLGTLVNHFYRHSDIYAAQHVLNMLPKDFEKVRHVRERIAQDWEFINTPDGFRDQYEKIGSTHDAAVINWSPNEPRYAALREWLQRHQDVHTVLDYGCAHGGYAINLLRELPHLSITGVDIDLHGIQMACEFANKFGVSDRWCGVVGDLDRLRDNTLPEMTKMYDAVVAQEVLEHVADPGVLLVALEGRVKDDGIVYITVPYGPWEYTDYSQYPYRAHVREFDTHDLHDLLDVKGVDNLTISAMPYGHSPVTCEPLGWWVVQYKVTAENRGKVGDIDMHRKITMQRPRETLSAALIAGPGCEETLHWCLRSLVPVADEVVIMDCGLSDEAKRVIASYGWRAFDAATPLAAQRGQRHFLNIRVFPGVDPKTQGFETPRNMAIEKCTQDWVLWIDTDEKLLQPERLHKYLRKNIFQGYSIRQHHFAVDTTFDADLPVRLFRNNSKLRFFGMIHEHPEEELNKGPGRTIVLSDVHIPHLGYLIESGRQVRFNRNWPMLQADIAKYPDRLLQKHFIMRDEMLLCTYELQQNGGRITDVIRERCEKVIALYREHFLGKGHFTNVDPISYYSQANAILAQGFDTFLQVTADKIDAKPNGALKVRFATSEDFLTEVTRRAKDAARPFENPYW